MPKLDKYNYVFCGFAQKVKLYEQGSHTFFTFSHEYESAETLGEQSATLTSEIHNLVLDLETYVNIYYPSFWLLEQFTDHRVYPKMLKSHDSCVLVCLFEDVYLARRIIAEI